MGGEKNMQKIYEGIIKYLLKTLNPENRNKLIKELGYQSRDK